MVFLESITKSEKFGSMAFDPFATISNSFTISPCNVTSSFCNLAMRASNASTRACYVYITLNSPKLIHEEMQSKCMGRRIINKNMRVLLSSFVL